MESHPNNFEEIIKSMYSVRIGYRIVKTVVNSSGPINEVKIRKNVNGQASIEEIFNVITNLIHDSYLKRVRSKDSVLYAAGPSADELIKKYEKLLETLKGDPI